MKVPSAPNTPSQAFIHPFLQISSTLAISHTREQNTLLARNARTPRQTCTSLYSRDFMMQRRGRQRERQKSKWLN